MSKNRFKKLKVSLERIVYQDEDDGFTVARVSPLGNLEDQITVVGNLPSVFPGQKLSLEGYWDYHDQYGRQFQVRGCKIELPATEAGIEKYLASEFIKGVGPVIAERITAEFGEEALNVIDQNPARLKEVEGIGDHRLRKIKEGWQEGKQIRNVMIFLKEHGISTSHAVKIYKEYGEDTVEVLKEDPYTLARDVFGIGFKTADKIAQKLGLEDADPARLRAGIEYTLREATDEGHLYLPRRELVTRASELLEASSYQVEDALQQLLENGRLVEENRFESGKERPTYLAPFYHGERGLAQRISRLNQAEPKVKENRLRQLVEEFSARAEVDYNQDQREAIYQSLASKVLLVTGGPGTGKTTVLRGIIRLMEEIEKKVLLAAPTGRAAKRLSAATDREAKTIHRLLGFRPPNSFRHDESNKLSAEVIVVDEVSMVDLLLANNLLKAVPPQARLILVGDKDQLPSVGPGNVLQDLLDAPSITQVTLTEIFRQARRSKIVTNAHRINRGKFPRLTNKRNDDFFFIEQDDPEAVADEIVELVSCRLPDNYGLDPIEDIQVLSPMRRGKAGVNNLNDRLQASLNPDSSADLSFTRRDFGESDKVMQIRNNYEKDVFNGDIGKIIEVDEVDQKLVVRFSDSAAVEYEPGDLSELVLAYAVTIHKSQGNEYPVVVLPLLTQHYVMLQQNLLYTGLTRASQLAVLIGSKKAIGIAVNNDEVQGRYTLLSQRLRANG